MFRLIEPPDFAGVVPYNDGLLGVDTLRVEDVTMNMARGLLSMIRAVMPDSARDGAGFVDSTGAPGNSVVATADSDEVDGATWILASVMTLATTCRLRGTPDTDDIVHTMAHHKLAGLVARAALTGFPGDTNMLVANQGATAGDVQQSIWSIRDVMTTAVGPGSIDARSGGTRLHDMGLNIKLVFEAHTVTGTSSVTDIFMWLSVEVKRVGEAADAFDSKEEADEEEEEETKAAVDAGLPPPHRPRDPDPTPGFAQGFRPFVFFVASDGAILFFIVDPRPGAVTGGWILDWGTTDVVGTNGRDEDGGLLDVLPAGAFHNFDPASPAYVLRSMAEHGEVGDHKRAANWIANTTRTLDAILVDHMANDPDVLRTNDYDPVRLNPGGMPLFGMSDLYSVTLDSDVFMDYINTHDVVGDIVDPWRAPGLPPLPEHDADQEDIHAANAARLDASHAQVHRHPGGAVRLPNFEVPAFYMRYLFSARYGYTGRCQVKRDMGPFDDDSPWRTLPDVVAATSAAGQYVGPSRSKRRYETLASHRVYTPYPNDHIPGLRPDGPPALLGPQPMYPPELEMNAARWRTNRFFQFGRIVLGSAVRRSGDAVADGLRSFPYRNLATGIALYVVRQLGGAVTPWAEASFDVPLTDWNDMGPWRNQRHWEDAVTFLRKFMTVHASQEVGAPLLAAASSDSGAFASANPPDDLPDGFRRGTAPLSSRTFFGPIEPSPDVTSTAKQEWHAGFSEACRATLGQSGVNDFTTLVNSISVIMATYLDYMRVEGAISTLIQSVSIVRRAFEATARAVGIRPFGFSVVDRRVVMNESAPGADPDASYLTRDAMTEVVTNPETGRKSRRRLRIPNYEEHDEDRPHIPESTELQEDERAIAAFIVTIAIRVHKRDAAIRENEAAVRERLACQAARVYGSDDNERDGYLVETIPAVLNPVPGGAAGIVSGDGTPAFEAEVRARRIDNPGVVTMTRVQQDALHHVWPNSRGGIPVPDLGGNEFPRVATLARVTNRYTVTVDRLDGLWDRCNDARAFVSAAVPPAPAATYAKRERGAVRTAVQRVWESYPPRGDTGTDSVNDARSFSFFFTLPETIAVGTVSPGHITIHDVAMSTVHTFDVDDVVSGPEGVGRTIASIVDLMRALRVKTFHVDPMAVGAVVGVPNAPTWPSPATDMGDFEADMETQLLTAAPFVRNVVRRGATRKRARFYADDFDDEIDATAVHLGVQYLDVDEDGYLSNEAQITALMDLHEVDEDGVYNPLFPSALTEEGKWATLCAVLLPPELDPVPHVSDTLVADRQEAADHPVTRREIAEAERSEQVAEHGDSVLRIAVAHMILRLQCAARDSAWANITFQDSCRAMPHNLTDDGQLDNSIPATGFHDVQEGAFTTPASLVVGVNRAASAKGTIMNNDDLAVRGSFYSLGRHIHEEMKAAGWTLRRDLDRGDAESARVAFPDQIVFDPAAVRAAEDAMGTDVTRHLTTLVDPQKLPDMLHTIVVKAAVEHPCTDPWSYDLCAFDGEDPETHSIPDDYLTKTFKADGALVSAHVHTPLGHVPVAKAATQAAIDKAVERAAAIGSQRNPSDAGSSVKAVFTALVHEVAASTANAKAMIIQTAEALGVPPPPTPDGRDVEGIDPENVAAGLILRPAHSELVVSITVGGFRTFVRPPSAESVRAADMDIPLYDAEDHVAPAAGAGRDPNRISSLVGRMSISYSPSLHAIAAGVIAQKWSPIAMLTRQRLPMSAFLRTGDLPAAPIIAFADSIYTTPQRSAEGGPTSVYLSPPKPWDGILASVWGPSCRMNDLVMDGAPHRTVIETIAMLKSDDTYRLKPGDRGDATQLSAGVCRMYLRLRERVKPGSHTATPWNVLTTRRVLVPSPTSSVWIQTLVASANEMGIVYPVAVAAYVMSEFLHAFTFIPALHNTVAALPASTSKPHVVNDVIFGVGSGTRVQFALIPFALFSPRFIVITPHGDDVVPVLRRLMVFIASLVESCDKPMRTLAMRTLHMLISVLATRTHAYGISGAPLLFGATTSPAILADRDSLMTEFSVIGTSPGAPKVEVAVGLEGGLTLHPNTFEHGRNVCCLQGPAAAGELQILRAQMWDPDAPDAVNRVLTWDNRGGASLQPSVTTRWVYTSSDGMQTVDNVTKLDQSTRVPVRKPGHYLLEVEFTSPTTGQVATSVCGPWEVLVSEPPRRRK